MSKLWVVLLIVGAAFGQVSGSPGVTGGGSIAGGTAGQPAVYTSGTALGAKPWPQGTDITVGAVCDGTTDDSAVLQTNLTAATGGLGFIPATKICGTSTTLTLPQNTSLWIGAGGSIKATAVLSAHGVVETAGTRALAQAIYGGGTIDCNSNADYGFWSGNFATFFIHDLTFKECLVNSIRLGDGSILSNQASIHDVLITSSRSTPLTGSVGISLLANTGDATIGPANVIIGQETGILTNSSNSVFIDNHVWGNGTSSKVSFRDNKSNTWIGNYADSPTQYGFYFPSTAWNSVVDGGTIFANSLVTDNTIIGVRIENSSPATISSTRFYGTDNTHRLAQDISAAGGSLYRNVIMSGIIDQNVVSVASQPTSLPWYPNPLASTNQTIFTAVANNMKVAGIVLPYPITTTKLGYQVGTTADNTAATYDIGLYTGAAGGTCTLVADLGAKAGTAFAPTISTNVTLSWAQAAPITLPAGRVYIAWTTSQAGTPATMLGASVANVVNFPNSAISIATGGTLPGSFTCPADANSGAGSVAQTIPWLSIY